MMQVCLNQFSTAAERKCIPERWWWWGCVSSRPSCLPQHANATVTAPHQRMNQHAKRTHAYLSTESTTVITPTQTQNWWFCACAGLNWMSLRPTNADNRTWWSISQSTFIAEDLINTGVRSFISIQRHRKHMSQSALAENPYSRSRTRGGRRALWGKRGAETGTENLRGWVKCLCSATENADITSALTHTSCLSICI